jgi:hypothetical protein
VVVVVVVAVERGRVDKGQRDKGRGPERVWAAGVHHLLLPAVKAQMTGRQKPVWGAFFAARRPALLQRSLFLAVPRALFGLLLAAALPLRLLRCCLAEC